MKKERKTRDMNVLEVSDNPNVLNPHSVSFQERMKQLETENATEKKKGNQRSPFSRWTQLNNEYTKELMLLALKYPKAHAILYFLVDQMDRYNACVCSMGTMEALLNVSRQTISKNIQVLKELGFIYIFKSGNTNVYAINDKVYWKSWSNNCKYSSFPANVVLALSEQDKQYQINLKKVKTETKKILLKHKQKKV